MTPLGQVLKGEARDALVFTGSSILNRLGSLVLLPLYWSRLSPADYGVLAVVTVIGAFQALLSSLSLDLAITRFYYEWPETARRRNVGAVWIWSWVSTFVTGGAFLLVFPILGPSLFPDVPFDPWLMLGIVANTLANLFIIPASVIRIRRMPSLFAAYNLGGFALTSCLGLWFVLVLDQGLRGLLVSMIWSNLILGIVGAAIMLRLSEPSFTSPGLRQAFGFALPANPSQLINVVGSVVDRLLLSQFTSLQTLGVYSVSLRFVEAIGALHSSLKMTFGPFMMKSIAADRDRGVELVASVTPYYIIPYVAAALGLSLFIGPLVRIIGQPEYLPIIEWVPWLAGIYVVSFLYFYYTNGLFLGNRTELLSVPALVRLAALVVTGLLLLPRLQLGGIVISRYISETVFLAVSLYLSQRIFHLPHRWSSLVALLVAGLACAAAGQLLTLDRGPWEIVAKAALWLGFLGLCWWIVGRPRRGHGAGTPAQSLAGATSSTGED